MIKAIKHDHKQKKYHSSSHKQHMSGILERLIQITPLRHVKKLRTQLLIIIIIAGVLSVSLFHFTWRQQPQVWGLLRNIPGIALDKDTFTEELKQEAQNYTLPESEQDEEGMEQFEPFFDLADKYTTIFIYGPDGIYVAGHDADVMKTKTWNFFSSMVFQITYVGYMYNAGEDIFQECFTVDVEFKNATAQAAVSMFHNARITIPYFIFSLGISIFLFLFLILLFMNRKIGHILKLKDEILFMSGGDLGHPVPSFGNDEIGILSQELDKLRIALDENMQQEAESRKANQDLITAMSHDLRTPLTILNGYLEVIKLKKKPEMQEEYLDRCLKKTDDIRQLTDRMFEYALIFEKAENIEFRELPGTFILQCLTEHIDFLQLAGFTVKNSFDEAFGFINGDETTLKRIFQNLFSNILKYGDKKDAVQVGCLTESNQLKITLVNSVKENLSGIESNHIGLKSVKKMIELHKGTLFVSNEGDTYIVEISLPFSP